MLDSVLHNSQKKGGKKDPPFAFQEGELRNGVFELKLFHEKVIQDMLGIYYYFVFIAQSMPFRWPFEVTIWLVISKQILTHVFSFEEDATLTSI